MKALIAMIIRRQARKGLVAYLLTYPTKPKK